MTQSGETNTIEPRPMTQSEVLAEFRAAGALLEGHFILSSGLRSPVFLQKMFIFQDPVRTAKLCKALAVRMEDVVEDGGQRFSKA